ncbi:MAG: acetate kinase [Bacilli bacterium]|nr:acetate kinase [Bacilli bacterium]
MKIMSINAGSSSLKFSLFNMDNEEVIASGLFERIGIDNGHCEIKYNGEKIEQDIDMENHEEAVKLLMDKLITLNIIKSLDEIDGIGHRVTAGGELFDKSVLVDDKVIEDIISIRDFAPLHNFAQATAVKAFRSVLPNTPMACVFDTTFHQTMEKEQFIYPTPMRWYRDYKVRKYGAHGTSHRYVSEEISRVLGRDDLRIIVCHIGSGGSVSAIKDGKCVDTSMGFTPLAGIIMGTRTGDIDPSILPYVMEKDGLNIGEAIDVLNKQSGLLGMSEKSSDMRDIVDGMNNGDEQCLLAFNKYCRAVTNYIAQYYVLLGGADVICFTAGIGEKSAPTRRKICENLACLGVKIDLDANKAFGEFAKISTDDSSIGVYVVPTNEELMIARDTLFLAKNS